MGDESDRTRDDATPEPGASSAEQDPWRDVLKGFDELGDAVTVWVKTAVNDPENRERAERLKTHFETAAHKVGEAVTSNEVGQQAKDVAVQAGGAAKDAGQRIGQEVAPSLADLFRSIAGGFTQAAAFIEERATATATAAAPTGTDADPAAAAADDGLQNPPED